MKFIYRFGGTKADGSAKMKNKLGGKGANLAEMSNLGIPVPPGFTISTDLCMDYLKTGKYPEGLIEEAEKGLRHIEGATGKKFGDSANPLLVSVRSGARISMPGMMDTILNLGLNDETVEGLAALTSNPRFAYDSYRRFVQTYGDVVLGVRPRSKDEHDPFEVLIDKVKARKKVKLDTELEAEDWKKLVAKFKELIKTRTGVTFPEEPSEQLWGAIEAVFRSWDNERAIAYRKLNRIPHDWGTAVNVQAMVFGNMGADSGTGVAFTRDPATGENRFYGEYLENAQGEDVVAGVRTPKPIAQLEREMPVIYKKLDGIQRKLESHYKDMQDMEFTVERGKLWMLQTRTGKRTGFAAIRIAVDMVDEKKIGRNEAMLRIEPEQLNQLLQPVFDAGEKRKAVKEGRVLAKGLPAGPGAATGKVVFNAHDAQERARKGEKVILTRIETSPEDIRGMAAASGILTQRGGMTSHAALVARQMGKVCVAGCEDILIDYGKRKMTVAGKTVKEGDFISIDGATGEVIAGVVTTRPSEVIQVLAEGSLKPSKSDVYQRFAKLMEWSDQVTRMHVRANADKPEQARIARSFGARGIGLCRTEHMFFEGARIDAVREMILADDEQGRRKALAKLLPMQREDFAGLFRQMDGFPVIIRTLDPPLHEFLPHDAKTQKELAEKIGVSAKKIKEKVEELHEFNPMLGHRGCRLGITYPEITETQVRAIFEAACKVTKEGKKVIPEVMIPLVGNVRELRDQRDVAERTAKQVLTEQGIDMHYMIGTMIEIPRAALTSDEIAEIADFYSYGTNDLTQTTLGFSRDDSGRFLRDYINKGIFTDDPFQTIDQQGVGKLVALGIELGRETNPKLEVGICGEHGGDPRSVEFCHRVGMNYVSCSPFRVPIARMATAQAALREKLASEAAKPAKKAVKKTAKK
ncbi:pyruvate, phosphate dikinase [candidate division WOR-3 bacterium]|nr:pyruvate, phosphate dikinase [candidate division WOR-3 bacterium]